MRAHLFGFGALVVTLVACVACEVHMNDGKPAAPTGAAPAPAPAPAPAAATQTPATSTRHYFNPNRVDPTVAAVDAGVPTTVITDAGASITTDAGNMVIATGDSGATLTTSAKKR